MDQRDKLNFGSLEYIRIVEFGYPSKLVLSKVANVADLRKSLNPGAACLDPISILRILFVIFGPLWPCYAHIQASAVSLYETTPKKVVRPDEH